jgi:integrase/recombinase XerD
MSRTSAHQKAQEFAALLQNENPDYAYLKLVFYHLRKVLDIEVPRQPRTLPIVPTEAEIQQVYEIMLETRRMQDVVIFKTFLYTGVRVGELVNILLSDVDFEQMQIRIDDGKGGQDRVVPFPLAFRETLALHCQRTREKGATCLFESSWKRPYTPRGIHKMLARYAQQVGLEDKISPHKLRHFFLLWLKKQGVDDALVQPYSGHVSRESLEIYSRLAISDAQAAYDRVMERFPI